MRHAARRTPPEGTSEQKRRDAPGAFASEVDATDPECFFPRLTPELSRAAKRLRLERIVSAHARLSPRAARLQLTEYRSVLGNRRKRRERYLRRPKGGWPTQETRQSICIRYHTWLGPETSRIAKAALEHPNSEPGRKTKELVVRLLALACSWSMRSPRGKL